MSVDLLAISPHPDDAELFCGGTLAAAAAAGRKVAIADLTRGELASNGSVEGRRASSLAACAALGIDGERPQLALPDGGLRADDEQQALAIASLLRVLRPRVLLAPWRADRHPDHVAAHALCERALFLAALARAKLHGEPHRVAHCYWFACHHDAPRYDLFVDVSAQMERWQAALDCYADQFRRGAGAVATPINEPDFLAQARARRAEWGRQSGVHFAEAFVAAAPRAVTVASLFGGDPS